MTTARIEHIMALVDRCALDMAHVFRADSSTVRERIAEKDAARAAVEAELRDALPQASQPEARLDALNTLCKMMHSGEEVEGDEGLAMLVPMDLWNEAQEALELLSVEDDNTEASQPLTAQEVEAIIARHDYQIHGDRARYIVRMTEQAHGIGAAQKGKP